MKGAGPKAGSSEIERPSAATPPEKSEKWRPETLTLRPSAAESLDSSTGCRVAALTRSGRPSNTRAMRTISPAAIFTPVLFFREDAIENSYHALVAERE